MNALGIDPKNLEYEFKKDWHQFQGSRVKLFLVAYLQKQLKVWWCALENVSPGELGKAQGAITEVKRMLALVERPHCPEDTMREVIAFLEKDENYA